MRTPLPLPFLLLLATLACAAPAQDAPFEIQDGDRVLFLGDTLLEREGTYGHIEARMAEQFPDRRFTVRNLAWSAETPRGWSRASFDPPQKGWERLQQQIADVQPTVVFLGFGMAASLEELGGIRDETRYGAEVMSPGRFQRELGDLISTIAPDGRPVRFVILGPISHEDMRQSRPAMPDPARHNVLLGKYSVALQELAAAKGARYVPLSGKLATSPLTDNGIHLGELGYEQVAAKVAVSLGWSRDRAANRAALRAAIVQKNELFFHRWRPQNHTYLFGFRKHEQGQNAREIPQFDTLIGTAEQAIEELKRNPATATPVPAPPAAPRQPFVAQASPTFDVLEGYEVSLWAENPLLEKPVQMNWDAAGRLWVASSSVYPQIEPGAEPRDRVLVLEDTDRDGRADKSSVFAERLLIPTGVAVDPATPAPGAGCYVGQSTELLHLTDMDGDGKADRKRIVLSGFGTEDTHHLIHTLRWGPDGRLYFNQSIYIHTHMETPWGVVRQNSGGVLAWDPRSERVEVLFNGFCNPWGHAWDQWGQSFITDGAGFQGISWGVPGAMYFTYEHGRKLLGSISPGTYPKFCGLEIVQSPHFPEDWQGSAVTCDFRAHRIVRFGISDLAEQTPPKSGYVTKELPDVLRTSDVAFRPIDVRHGPDGALYVADWSNPVINHGEVDFRDPRRDKHRGRIWRISRKGAAVLPWEKLSVEPAALLAKLASKSAWEKEQAAGLLAHRVKTPLKSSGTMTPEASLASRRLGFSGPETGSLEKEPRARAILARTSVDEAFDWLRVHRGSLAAAFEESQPQVAAAISRLERDANDPHPRVRLEAIRRISEIPSARAAAIVLAIATGQPSMPQPAAEGVLPRLEAPADDPFYAYALWLSINDLAKPWTAAVMSGDWKIESPARERQLQFALESIDVSLASQVLARVLEDRPLTTDGGGAWIELIGKAGGPGELRKLFNLLTGETLAPPVAGRIITALGEAARLRNARPSGDLAQIVPLARGVGATSGRQAPPEILRLLGEWRLPEAPDLLSQAAASAAPEVRGMAFAGFRVLGKEGLAALEKLAASKSEPAISRAAVLAMASIEPAKALGHLPALLSSTRDEADALAVWRDLLGTKGAADAIAGKFPKDIPPPAAAAGLRAARELGNKGAKLVSLLTPIAGAQPQEPALAAQSYGWMADLVKRDGDPGRGEEIYRRAQLGCVTCHAIGGAGGKVGPELTSLGASAPLDYIIESTLAPAVKVKEGYHAVALSLQDGGIATGIQVRETPQEVILRDVTGTETSVPKAKITTREMMGSIMPAGLVEALPQRERWDLFAFMSQLGKPGVYDASKGDVARVWWLHASAAPDALPPMPQATPAFTLVDGRLTRELLQPTLTALQAQPGIPISASARFQVPTAGRVPLRLTGAVKAWIDGKPLDLTASEATPTLEAGEHIITVQLNAANLPEAIQLTAREARFLGN